MTASFMKYPKQFLAGCFMLPMIIVSGQNPIGPPGHYIADPAAHVWKDGKIYVYGSLDESTVYYCSHRHHVLSSENLVDWQVHENALVSKGEGDQVPYSDSILYAPDCQYRDGRYYLYYTLNSPDNVEGVATSDSPEGPFLNGTNIELHDHDQIDPAVFIDDDGSAYYLWGQFTLKMARLKPNMIELEESTIRDSILTEKEHFFHEGAYLVKREGTYYMIFADLSRAGRPTCLGYATSDSPMGPYKYRGIIIDNDHSDPAVWNNHGSIAEFKGQWYVFYHRSTHGTVRMRKACVEPIFFNKDGSISEVEMTSQGAAGPLQATEKIDAERACLLYGNVRIQAVDQTENEELAGIREMDQVAYKYIDFGEGVDSVEISVMPGADSGRIELVLDRSWGRPVCGIDIPGEGDGYSGITLRAGAGNMKGVHTLWLRFLGEGEELYTLDWLRFY